MHYVIKTISGNYPDIASHPEKYFFRNKQLFFIGIFYPSGELISLHRHRCSPFAVFKYSFMGYCLAAAAISTRE